MFLKKRITLYPIGLSILILYSLLYVNKKILGPDSMTDISYRYDYLDEEDQVIKFIMADKDNFRIYSMLPWPNRFSAFMIEDVSGYHAAKLKVYDNFSSKISKSGPSGGILDLMNVKYIISTENQSRYLQYVNIKPDNGFSTSIDDYKVYIYENKNFLTRAFFVSNMVGVKSKQQQDSILLNPSFNPRKDSFVSSDFIRTQYNPSDAEIKSIESTANSITVKVNCKSNQFLIISDTYYNNGWKSSLNGKNINAFMVNGVFRGFEIPPGDENILKMSFSPPDIFYGNIFSACGFMIIVLLIFNQYFYLFRYRK